MEGEKGYIDQVPHTAQPPPYGQPHGVANPGYGQQYPPNSGSYPSAIQPGAVQSSMVVLNHNTTNPGTPSSSHLGFAIFVCLCCCWPIGIAAIIFAVRVNEENARGNWAGAQSASKTALWCSVAALIFGSVWLIVIISLAATGNLLSYHANGIGSGTGTRCYYPIYDC